MLPLATTDTPLASVGWLGVTDRLSVSCAAAGATHTMHNAVHTASTIQSRIRLTVIPGITLPPNLGPRSP